jgi:peptidoglycan-associated lipoprotein
MGLVLSGCPKKTVVKDEPSVKKSEDAAAAERARLEAEKKEREAKEAREKELARIREEEAKRKEQEKKDFEKSLVAQKTPGIEGQVFESSMLKRVHFDFDRYDIRTADIDLLKENAALLKKYPAVKVQVEGHCDERGTNEYNLALGERRANSVKRYLVSLGIEDKRIATISYGEEKPLDPSHAEEAWTKNRRADFVILSK